MALNTLTLSVSAGLQGRPFEAAIVGLTAGTVVGVFFQESSPGFGIVNGRVRSTGLPYQVSTIAIRERVPSTGETLISRIDISALTQVQREALAASTVPGYKSYRIVENYQSDSTYAYSLAIKDSLGATTVVAAVAGGGAVTLGALTLSGSLQIGTATSGTISGATVGSTITSNIPGITVNSGARTYSGTPTGSAATIANGLVETLAGATNTPRSSSVDVAAALIAGAAATNFAIAPTLTYHINSATVTTLGGNATFTASIPALSNTLTVTSVTSGVLALGMFVTGGSAPGLQFGRRIVAQTTGTAGGAGTYTLSDSPTNPAIPSGTMTATGDYTVLSVSEKNGGPALTASATTAPIIITEMPDGSMQLGRVAGGRLMLRFANIGGQNTGSFAKITTTGLDSHNITMLAALRSHSAKGGCFANLSTSSGHTILGAFVSSSNSASEIGQPYVSNAAGSVTESVLPSNRNALFVGASLTVFGSSVATSDGIGGAGVSMPSILYHNDQSQTVTANVARKTAQTDIVIGQNQSGGLRMAMDLAELSIWSAGEFASANYASRSLAAMTAIRANYGVVPFTRRLLVFGDSRTEENYSGGDQLGLMLARQQPANVQVVPFAYSGGTLLQIWQGMADAISMFNTASQLSSSDRVLFFTGHNELTTSASVWPSINTAAATDARAEETYNGTSLDFAGTATMAVQTITIQSVTSGKLLNGMPVNMAGVTPGAYVGSGAPLTTGNSTVGGTVAITGGRTYTVGSATALTAQWPSLVRVVSTLLTRGFEVAVGTNIDSTSSYNTIWNNHIKNDLKNDVLAGPGQTYDGKVKIVDLAAITLGGQFIFGADLLANVSSYFRDSGVHPTDYGRTLLYNGGDTPANAWKALAA